MVRSCESLTKLDLTVNFIGDLTSVESLQNLENLRDLYLIGNPCADYEGYREFVIATLPQLKKRHFERREREKEESAARKEGLARRIEKCNGDLEALNEEFWQEKQAYTPESRLETHEFIQLKKKKENKETSEKTRKSKRTVFFASDGRPYNINEPKIDFKLDEIQDGDGQYFLLDLGVYKHMDTTLIDCDVQANYVRVTLKSKVFQMALPSEVHPDRAKVTRSQITGRLLMRLPKVQSSCILRPTASAVKQLKGKADNTKTSENQERRFLEIDDSSSKVDWRNIISPGNRVAKNTASSTHGPKVVAKISSNRCDSPDFVDDPNVPPLI
ncbi:Protein tilB [Sparganum proliferum]